MTQPAKVTEPSMEEILASIRRIIADDEAKPPPTEAVKPEKAAAPAASAPKLPAMNNVPPPKITPTKPVAEKPAPPPAAKPAPAPAPAPAASNSQDDIDALLAGLDEATPAPEVRAPEPEPEPEPDVLELTDEMAVDPAPTPPPPPPSFRKVEPRDDLEFAEAAPPRPSPGPSYAPVDFDAPPLPPPILAQSTVSAVESAFNSLAHTVLSSNARTLEDLVKEMLRPMLKSWLDDNLPGLVERIVKAEIERVSRGSR
ncbi:hypothetical protein AYJ54_02270 [Bradyrhizobium centrolobii]|uniref:Pole-organizing protein PopZ n=1 Tax=Bradyrhizobium centrolobii TaxID=1505087 RepID=A0A176YGH7_9BRAD|nr:DUF2497 domain-containing protein [Bradyrhizobium centrolobii]OAF05742.1 hypothetical protein AYJ54_02270 [Bradyrhizobium centrolobii]